jgi:hypothetical protein
MAPGQSWHIGLTRLVPSMRGGRWLCGALIFGSLYGLFTATGVFGTTTDAYSAANRSAALFFCVIIGYIVPVFHYISDRTVQAIDELAPYLALDAEALVEVRQRVHHKTPRWFATALGIGFGAATAHNLVLAVGGNIHGAHLPAWLAMIFGTALTWVVLTTVIAALIDNALLLNRLARTTRLDPLVTRRLHPFARVAVMSTLVIIGAQAAFPIMILDTEMRAVAFVPGLIATVVPMIVLALLPIWPLHRRLRSAKRTLLDDVDARIAMAPRPGSGPGAIAILGPLLAWRREIKALPDWPFDMGIVGRLAFYLIIPPMTWVAAALIQHLVEQVL